MDSRKVVAVTGATGFVGRYIVLELLARGYGVRALYRDREKARDVLPADPAVELQQGDVTDAKVVRQFVQGSHAVIHLVGIIRETQGGQTFERMHVQATKVVVDACRGSGVSRYVHMSALGVSPEGKAEYQRTKWAAEQYVRRSADDLKWTIFRPGLIHGHDGEFVTLMADLSSGEVPPYYFMPYFVRKSVDTSVPLGPVSYGSATVAPIFVEDVAAAFVRAIDTPGSFGEIYNLAGPDTMDWPEMLTFFRDVLPGSNKAIPPFYVPGEHAVLIAKAAKTLGLGSLLPFDAGQAIMGQEDSFASCDKVRDHLGLTPRPLRESVEAYASMV